MNGKWVDNALNFIRANRGIQSLLTGAFVGGAVGFISAEPGSRLAHGFGGALMGAGLGLGGYHGVNWLANRMR